MSIAQNLTWKVYSIVLGTAATLVVQKVLHSGWKFVTGDQPPNPNDPDVPMAEAGIWALSSGIGLGMAQLTTNRYLARKYRETFTGAQIRVPAKTKVTLSD